MWHRFYAWVKLVNSVCHPISVFSGSTSLLYYRFPTALDKLSKRFREDQLYRETRSVFAHATTTAQPLPSIIVS